MLKFFVTMRAILDSKFYEHCLDENYRNHSSMSDFTYSWLASFAIEPHSKEIVN
jgi:hypothetical protein